jgi:autoinducer 2-degrading protein
MHIVCVTVKVKPGMGDAFLTVAGRNRAETRKEPGNVRFDILRAADTPAAGAVELFFLFEVYKTRADFAAHQQTPHYLAFREEVADMMAEPRQGVHYIPADADPFG